MISLPLTIIGLVVLYPICKKYNISQFPKYFKWFDSVDSYISRDTSVIERVNTEGVNKKYYWVALRNPINYFSYIYLGFKWNNPTLKEYVGSPDVGDSSKDHAGYKYIEIQQDSSIYYEYYYVFKWSDTKCLRFRMGYKIGDPLKNKNGEYQEQVFVLQPYKTYKGK